MKKTISKNKTALSTALIAIVIIVVAVAAAGAYYIMTQNNHESSPSETSTPSASPTATTTPSAFTSTPTSPTASSSTSTSPTTTPTASPATTTTEPTPTPTIAPTSTSPNVAAANSLQYSVSLNEAGVSQGQYTYYGKNAGTTNFMMRIDVTDADGAQSILILNGAEQKAWTYSDGEWTDISIAYTSQFNIWNGLWQGYVNSLGAWTGVGDWTYTDGTTSVRIFSISINPVLADSLFQPA